MFIKNYGLLWQLGAVDWGIALGPAGSLLGILASDPNSAPVNFRNQIGFFALYNQENLPVYCGYTGLGRDHALFQRLQQKRNLLPDGLGRFSWFGVATLQPDGSLPERDEQITGLRNAFLEQIGTVIVHSARPLENIGVDIFRGAEKYEQATPE